MINKDELIKSVAQSCGVSIEISSFFFEVFVNRLSNKLKPGDVLHFNNYGFFHKRNCRIHIEKTSDSPTPKSYLIQLVLFSSDIKIKNDLNEVHFLKIPNLKTLWVDDKEFQKSLNAGDFTPHTDRNQLIKSFATKAEVIISGLRKDYDSDLVEELIIPLTFDLNFLVKSGQRKSSLDRGSNLGSSPEQKSSNMEKPVEPKVVQEPVKPEKLKNNQETKKTGEDGLPWNYGTKFLEKDKQEHLKTVENINTKTEKDSRKEQAARLKDFEPVTSHRPTSKEDKFLSKKSETIKFNVHPTDDEDSDKSNYTNKFTEVKSKTDPYRQRKDLGITKRSRFDKYSSGKYSDEKAFTSRRNFLPIVALVSFIIIAIVIVYIYLIKGSESDVPTKAIVYDIKPANNVNVINRDFDFVISYPYPKMGDRIEMSGFSSDLFSNVNVNPEIKKETEPELKTEKITELNEKPKVEVKTETPVEEKPKPVVEEKKENINRIFLHKGFYIVYVGKYKSEEAANREADRYFELGYNAFVEAVETRDRTQVYKLNVGDFTSEEFARQFQEKYIK